tara:strand:- start:770 stop:1177 length:408 start_codon:yes stop_codon:yes gene_type:complete
MVENSECHICYEHKSCNKFKTLVCNHKLCYCCFKKLLQNTCPFCRHLITLPNPSGTKNVSYHSIPISNQNLLDTTSDIYIRADPYSRIRRNMTRNRRRNLSFDDVLKKRRRIKNKCKRKWMRKNGRLAKINFYDL